MVESRSVVYGGFRDFFGVRCLYFLMRNCFFKVKSFESMLMVCIGDARMYFLFCGFRKYF